VRSASDWKDKRESRREKMRGNNVRAAEVDMDVDARRVSKRRDNKREKKKSESKRGNDVKAYELDVDVQVTMALRRPYAP